MSAFISPAHLARLDHCFRRSLTRLPPTAAIALYSRGRRSFLEQFAASPPRRSITPPEGLGRTVWNLEFRSPVMNAAGMFKKGEAYNVMAAQGAGAYLAGTTTSKPRPGNRERGISTPFIPYPRSGAASNWLGLPNPGHAAVAERLATVRRQPGMPLGASLAADSPVTKCTDPVDGLVEGLQAYDRAGVDFIELNESCPNTEDDVEANDLAFEAMAKRLRRVAERFLRHRARRLPILLKLSTDTDPEIVPRVVDLLVELGFDGLVFGNTSIAYADMRAALHRRDRRLFDRFVKNFGGGVSGRPLKQLSLSLIRATAHYVRAHHPGADFHLVRVGGVEDANDVRESLDAGASLVQWYTGYFEAFAHHGHQLYASLYDDLTAGAS